MVKTWVWTSKEKIRELDWWQFVDGKHTGSNIAGIRISVNN